MSTVSYIANGFARVPTKDDRRYGMAEVRLYNPTQHDTKINISLYYEDQPPKQLPELELEAENNRHLLVFPGNYPDFFPPSGTWGAKIISEEVLIIDHIMAAGIEPPPYEEKPKTMREMLFSSNVKYQGGVCDTLAAIRPAKLWYFADGFYLKLNPATAAWPFNEIEWYHIFNPNKRDTQVTMKCYYKDGTRDTFSYTVKAERVLIINNHELVKPNNDYGLKFISSEPVIIQAERFIYGLHSIEEWGMHIHMPRPGVPAPLEINEEVE